MRSKIIIQTSALIIVGVIIGLASSAVLGFVFQQPVQQKLVLAVQPTLAAAEVLQRAKPIEAFLEREMPEVDVEIYVPTSYAAVVESLRRGHAQAALMGAWPSYLAWKLGEAEIVLAEIRTVGEGEKLIQAPQYYSYWVVMPDSPIKSVEDLRGKKVAMPSPISTSGYVAPLAKLVELGYVPIKPGSEADPNTFFQVVFTGGYAQSWTALKNGDVEAAVIAGDIPASLYFEVMNNTRVVGVQGPIPSHAVVFAKDLKEPIRSKLISALLKLGEQEPQLMRQFVSALFVRFEPATSEQHLGALRKYLELTNLRYTERVG
ncbi:MAG: phosphate/phosphite/phosphonate ABC transporter substrate-binding protein [Candidatus Caldarchaeum sp.]|nr:phosphate/phosphite/phosphonate ABC transporter substrate-binding protein [Candidatus Caldarchaeum sp.]MDW8360271.1 phosphate/phosphite/phosphonate ABC transporter substrate-binding protein [Candidatus Caldarchaeum sp.]